MIELRVLGTLDLRDASGGGNPATVLSRPKRVALLVYLALAGNGFHQRDALVGVFWPELSQRRARRALSQALHVLRKALGPDVLVTRGSEEVGLDPSRLWCDAVAFEAALDAGEPAVALEHYGGLLLNGFAASDGPEFERWVADAGERLSRLAVEAARDLAAEFAEAGAPTEALRWLRRGMAWDPYDEDLLRRTLELLARLGDRSAAVREYETFATRLAADLDLEPDPETRDWIGRLREDPGSFSADEGEDPIRAGADHEAEALEGPGAIRSRREGTDLHGTGREAREEPRDERGAGRDDREPDREARQDRDPAGAERDEHGAERERSPAPTAPAAPVQATPLPAAPVRWAPSRLRAWAVAGAAVALVVAGIWALALKSEGVRADPPAGVTRVAVLPFDVRGAERFAYLGEGMVDLLSLQLETPGEIQTIDPRVLLPFVHERGLRRIDPAAGADVAGRFDAGAFVLGSVVEASGRLQFVATLYDRRGRRLASAAAAIHDEGTVLDAVDEIARELLAGRHAGRAPSRSAALTTRSLPALKAYLQGERAWREGRFEDATAAYRRAVVEDSTFALGYSRLAGAAMWAGDVEETQRTLERAMRWRDRLPEPARSLLLSSHAFWVLGDATAAEAHLRRAAFRHPDDPEVVGAWAETLFHQGRWGFRSGEVRVAFERLLELRPDDVPALLHLARIDALEGRLGALDSIVDRSLELEPIGEHAIEMRALKAFAGGDAADRRRVVESFRGLDDETLTRLVFRLAAFTEAFEDILPLAALLIEPGRSPIYRAQGRIALAFLEAGRGRMRAARAHLAEAERLDRRLGLRARALLAAIAVVPPSTAEARDLVAELEADGTASAPPEAPASLVVLLHDPHFAALLSGLLEARAGEASAERRALALERARPPASVTYPALIRAEAEFARGRPEGGLLRLGSEIRSTGLPHAAIDVFRRADALRALGRDAEALRWYDAFVQESPYALAFAAPAHFWRAKLHERAGERSRAIHHHARFLALWSDADPELQPRVVESRRALARLNPHAERTKTR